MDKIVAKTKGELHAIKARLDGLVGVWRTLAEDHGEAAAMLKRASDDATKRTELWPQIRSALTAHEKAELRAVYPVLRQHPELRDLADEHDAEAKDLEEIISQLNNLSMQSREADSLFDELVQAVTEHVEVEEQHIFPRAQDVLGTDVSRDLEAKFVAAKKQILAAV